MKHIYACKSTIHGMGLRIGDDAKRGDVIFTFAGKMQFKINKHKRDALAHPNWIGVAKNWWIDPEKPFKFLNHTCEPNVGTKGKLTVVALKDIKAGEELTLDYSIIEGDMRWEMACACGNKNCRRIIRSVHSIPERQFKKYLPYVPVYFKKLYLQQEKIV